jgi:putative hydrolase of HD superfamily
VARERAAIETIRGLAGGETGEELRALWLEFEARETVEARVAVALDHLEVQIQHNLADLATWEPVEYGLVYTKMDAACAFDPFLVALCEAVKAGAEAKMRAGGVDPERVKAGLSPTRPAGASGG